MQVCTSLQADNHASTPPLSFLQAGCPSCHPTNSVKEGGNGTTAQSSAANAGCVLLVFVNVVCTVPVLKIFIFTRINISGSKRNGK